MDRTQIISALRSLGVDIADDDDTAPFDLLSFLSIFRQRPELARGAVLQSGSLAWPGLPNAPQPPDRDDAMAQLSGQGVDLGALLDELSDESVAALSDRIRRDPGFVKVLRQESGVVAKFSDSNANAIRSAGLRRNRIVETFVACLARNPRLTAREFLQGK